MKKIIYSILAVLCTLSVTSCGDMLETESTRQSFDPELNSKTDSVSYALGILHGMQQLADQYYFIGEMRGELVTTTDDTDNNLRELSAYTADASNKYDSAYVYYNVINNCNYYLAHRDTALYTGSRNVVMNEYIAVAAIRAWVYMTLAKTYGTVPYFTEPLTEISVINNNDFPQYNLNQIADKQIEILKELIAKYPGYISVPSYSKTGSNTLSLGSTNFSVEKKINPEHIFFPVRLVLGDLYLESGQYDLAARQYFEYINASTDNHLKSLASSRPDYWSRFFDFPDDYSETNIEKHITNVLGLSALGSWSAIFNNGSDPTDVITYIPMAVSKLYGTTSQIPVSYGYNYYSTTTTNRIDGVPTVTDIQIKPSKAYHELADSGYYYYNCMPQGETDVDKYKENCSYIKFGDNRRSIMKRADQQRSEIEDTTLFYIGKNRNATIYLYRGTTVYLRLAEALNRMGYPDAAFAILKDGISVNLSTVVEGVGTKNAYLSQKSYNLLCETLPFLSEANMSNYPKKEAAGIHQHGAGLTQGQYTLYQYDFAVGNKMDELKSRFNINYDHPTKQDTINIVEDLICDEYALEFAFEGTRFYDLVRIANHKNNAGTYPSGDLWLSDKLRNKKAGVTTKNCFLPFQ